MHDESKNKHLLNALRGERALIKSSRKVYVYLGVVAILLAGLAIYSGWLNKKTIQTEQPVAVKVMQVVKKDVPITYEFVGKVKAKNEVKVMSKVSGNIVAKMVNGGEKVNKGQPLFRVDNKQYVSAIKSAQATLDKSQATLRSSRRTADRYAALASQDAIARETADSYQSQAEEDEAAVEANQAALREAVENERDTLIVSPVDGRIDINDVSLGYYVVAGSTTMATVSSVNPVWVQFTMSENEYLKLLRSGNGMLLASLKDHVILTLSDGTQYPLAGRIEQVDRGLDENTGTITMKAAFENPDNLLSPGMFAKIVAQGEIKKDAVLIPQKAVKELLDKTIVMVVTADNQAESRQVKLGNQVGDMWVVEEGLTGEETVIVEGIDKVKKGTALAVTVLEAGEAAAFSQQ